MKRMGKSILALVLAYAMIIGNVGSGAFTSVAFAAEDAFGDYVVEESVAGTEIADDFAAPAAVEADDAFAGADVFEEAPAAVADVVEDDAFAAVAAEPVAVEAVETSVEETVYLADETETASSTQATGLELAESAKKIVYGTTELSLVDAKLTTVSGTETLKAGTLEIEDKYAGDKKLSLAKGKEFGGDDGKAYTVASAFGVDYTVTPAKAEISVEAETITGAVGEEINLEDYVKIDGAKYEDKLKPKFALDDKDIENGVFKPTAAGTYAFKVGIAQVSFNNDEVAEYEYTDGKITVNVSPEPVAIGAFEIVDADPNKISVLVDGELKISVKATNSGATTRTVSYESSNEGVLSSKGTANVDKEGYFNLTAKGVKAGITTLVVTANDKDAVKLSIVVQVVTDENDVLSIEPEVGDDLANYTGDIKALAYETSGEPKLWIGGYDSEYAYTGAKITPVVNVYEGLTKLTLKKDYAVSYKDNKKSTDEGKYDAKIIVKFKGNYAGKGTLIGNFRIRPAVVGTDPENKGIDILVSDGIGKAKASGVKGNPVFTQVSTGKTVAAKKFKIDNGETVSGYQIKKVTKKDTNYVVSATQNTIEARVYGVTNANNISKAKIEFANASKDVNAVKTNNKGAFKGVYYNGAPIYVVASETQAEQFENEIYIKSLTIGKGNNAKTLKYDEDYVIKEVYNNVEPGKAVVVIEASPDSTNVHGSKAFTFSILKNPVTRAKTETVEYSLVSKVQMNNNSAAKVVNENWDIHFEVGNALGYAVSGTQTASGFQPASSLESASAIQKADPNMYYSQAGLKGQRIVVKNDMGVRLVEGVDFTVKYDKNKQSAHTGGTATIKFKGKRYSGKMTVKYPMEPLKISNQVAVIIKPKKNGNPAVTVMSLVDGKNLKVQWVGAKKVNNAVVTVEAKDNKVIVAGMDPNFTDLGTIEVPYKADVANSIAKAKIKLSPATYNGKIQTIENGRVKVKSAKLGGKDLTSNDYTVRYYFNNINKGTARVVFEGVNARTGSQAVKFKIAAKNNSAALDPKQAITVNEGNTPTSK